MHAVMLAGTSALMLVWRPCRSREGRMPRSAVAILLLSAAGLWAGSLAMVIHLLVGSDVGLLEACGRAWGLLADGPPSAARTGVAAAWLLAFPVRAGVRVGGRLVGSGRLRRHLCASGRTLDGYPDTVLVDGLGTPAATIGILRRVVAVDGAWWTSASSVHRRVVLAHEHAHRRGLHGLIEAAAVWLSAPLPAGASSDFVSCVRRHLEALADDAAARSCGRDHAGRALAELSLAAARPAVGLAVTGDGLWRARRLLASPSSATLLDRMLVQASWVAMGLCAGFVAVQAAVVLTAGWAATPCSL